MTKEKKNILGSKDMPYDPEDKLQSVIIEANDVIKVAEEEDKKEKEEAAKPKPEPTLGAILDAVTELTKSVGDLAKAQNEMKTRHDKWVKAGKF